jgi:hypothetical protein
LYWSLNVWWWTFTNNSHMKAKCLLVTFLNYVISWSGLLELY